jgi:TonB family protein
MVELMIRAIVVAGLATAAAWLFELGLASSRMPRRFAWTFALVATSTLPFLPRLVEQSPVAAIPQITIPAAITEVRASVSGTALDYAQLVWIALSCMALVVFFGAFVRLQREQRTWRAARIANAPVLMSRKFGPAVVGFAAPAIVVPEWVERTSHQEQRLIILHEREHIRAGDQLQLLLSIIATIAMPWNPFVWLQTRRLKFTIEADCDQRVLALEPDAARYATLLVDVGARQVSDKSGLLLTPALAEHRNGLERRLVMLAEKLIANRWKAAGLMVVGAGLTAIACESRLPQEPQQPAPQGAVTDVSLPRRQQQAGPIQLNDMPSLMEKHYPPLLKNAGIGGRVGVKVIVRASGKVEGHEVILSSGHEALDQAALRVVRETEILPTRVPAGQEPKDRVEQYILDFDPKVNSKRVVRTPGAGVLMPSMVTPQEQAPQYTPYTEMPRLANRDEVFRLLVKHYPPALREAGIGGTTLLWALIDESGYIVDTKVKTTSGHDALDQAAAVVTRQMKFVPAKNNETHVKVWVQLPVVFAVK